jgi:ketosteroid isomerase-like protein
VTRQAGGLALLDTIPPVDDGERVLREFNAAFNARDLERMGGLTTEDVTVTTPNGVSLAGAAGLAKWARKQWEDESEIPRFAELKRVVRRDDLLYVWVDLEMRWRDGGEVAGTQESGGIWRLRDGRLSEFTAEPDRGRLAELAGVEA